MSQLQFLFDECTDPDLIDALLRREPAIDVIRVTWEGGPPSGTRDPELLIAAESMGRMLVSYDRKTIPRHLKNYYGAGRHTHGVALMKKGHSFRVYVDDLLTLWSATEAEEWIDSMIYIPF